jgi:hypothetical protein
MKKAPEYTLEDWESEIKSLGYDVYNPAPGFFSNQQLMQKFGLGRTAMLNKLRELIKAGKVERRVYNIPASDGRRLPTAHYRMIKAGERVGLNKKTHAPTI